MSENECERRQSVILDESVIRTFEIHDVDGFTEKRADRVKMMTVGVTLTVSIKYPFAFDL